MWLCIGRCRGDDLIALVGALNLAIVLGTLLANPLWSRCPCLHLSSLHECANETEASSQSDGTKGNAVLPSNAPSFDANKCQSGQSHTEQSECSRLRDWGCAERNRKVG